MTVDILVNGKLIHFEKFGEINFGKSLAETEKLNKTSKKKIEKMYHDVAKQIDKKIALIGLKPNQTATDQLDLLQLQDLKKEIEKNLKEVSQGTTNLIYNSMNQAAQAATKDMTAWLNSFGVNISTGYAHVPQKVISEIVSGELYRQSNGKKWEFSKAIWGDYNKSTGDLSYIVAKGIAENKPLYDIAKDLEIYVNPKKRKPYDWSKNYPGSKKQIDFNAYRLAQTMTHHVYERSVVEMAKTNPFIEGIMWRAEMSPRTCEICEQLNGTVFPVDELPLDHPCGRCEFVPIVKKSDKEIAQDLADWVFGDNKDPKVESAMQELAKQCGFTKADIDISKLKKIASGTAVAATTPLAKHKVKSPPQQTQNNIPVSQPVQNQQALQQPVKDFDFYLQDSEHWIERMVQQTRAEWDKIENENLKNLSDVEREGIEIYSSSSYRRMNTYLRYVARGKTEAEAQKETYIKDFELKAISDTDNGLKKCSLGEEKYLRRGTGLGDIAGLFMDNPDDLTFRKNTDFLKTKTAEELNSMFAGASGEYTSFTSTAGFINKGFAGDLEVIFQTSKKASATPIMSLSEYPSECEILLNKNTKVQCIKIEKSEGNMFSKIRMYLKILD